MNKSISIKFCDTWLNSAYRDRAPLNTQYDMSFNNNQLKLRIVIYSLIYSAFAASLYQSVLLISFQIILGIVLAAPVGTL